MLYMSMLVIMNLFPFCFQIVTMRRTEHFAKTNSMEHLLKYFCGSQILFYFSNICIERFIPYPSVSEGLFYTRNVTIKGIHIPFSCTPDIALENTLFKRMSLASHTLDSAAVQESSLDKRNGMDVATSILQL